MQFKVLMCAALSAVMFGFVPITQTVAAALPCDIVSPLYDIADKCFSELQINGSDAICSSRANSDNAVKITAVQTLQKQGIFQVWSKFDNTEWTKTVYSDNITMSNTKSELESGTYRLKTVFTLTDENGKTKKITVYSSEEAVD